jgi:transposase
VRAGDSRFRVNSGMLGRMKLALHQPEDLDRLRERVSAERGALQRDRYRAVLLVAAEALERGDVARRLGRSPRFVDEWAGRYRRGGLAALTPRKPPGQRARLAPEQVVKLKERLAAGPTDADGVCTLRGKDVVRILEAEFGVKHTIGSVYSVLHRIGYSCLTPRPRHEKNDPRAIDAFEAEAPFLSAP